MLLGLLKGRIWPIRVSPEMADRGETIQFKEDECRTDPRIRKWIWASHAKHLSASLVDHRYAAQGVDRAEDPPASPPSTPFRLTVQL
jgi:hypothetical protein